MPGSESTRKAFCYLLLFSATRHAIAGYTFLLKKPWCLNPSLFSTTITAEFFPFLNFMAKVPLPLNNSLVNGIVFLLYLHLALGCLGMYIFGTVILLEMLVIMLKRMARNEQVWVRDPLDILDPTKQNVFEKIFLTGAWGVFNVWGQIAVLLVIISTEWDIYYIWQHSPEEIEGLTPDTATMVLYTYLGVGAFMTFLVTCLGVCLIFT